MTAPHIAPLHLPKLAYPYGFAACPFCGAEQGERCQNLGMPNRYSNRTPHRGRRRRVQ